MSRLPPSEIRFMQNSILDRFGGRDGKVETIEETFKELLYGETAVEDIRHISVVERGGVTWVISGNRRLYIYQKLEKYGRISTIPVNYKRASKPRVGILRFQHTCSNY